MWTTLSHFLECPMPHFRSAYPPDFRRQLVELSRSGRTPEELAREFEPTAQSIANLVKQGRSRRRQAYRWPDMGRARRTDPPTSREPAFASGARYPVKGGGLVRAGEQGEPERVFRFMSALPAHLPDQDLGPRLQCLCVRFPMPGAACQPRREQPLNSTDTEDPHHLCSSRNTYSAPRIHADFKAEGVTIGKKRVARRMKAAGLSVQAGVEAWLRRLSRVIAELRRLDGTQEHVHLFISACPLLPSSRTDVRTPVTSFAGIRIASVTSEMFRVTSMVPRAASPTLSAMMPVVRSVHGSRRRHSQTRQQPRSRLLSSIGWFQLHWCSPIVSRRSARRSPRWRVTSGRQLLNLLSNHRKATASFPARAASIVALRASKFVCWRSPGSSAPHRRWNRLRVQGFPYRNWHVLPERRPRACFSPELATRAPTSFMEFDRSLAACETARTFFRCFPDAAATAVACPVAERVSFDIAFR